MTTLFPKPLDKSVSQTQDGLAIVANGDIHAAISSGQFVYVKNHDTLAEGLYKATSAIAQDGALSTSNLTPDGAGGLNDLQSQVTALNSKLTKRSFSLTPPSGWTMTYNNCYAYGNIVCVSGMFNNTTAQSAKRFDMGNCIPNEYRCPYRVGFTGFNNVTDNPLHGIIQGQDISFYRPQTEDLTSIEFSATYII